MNASNIQTQDTVSIQNIDRGKIRQSDNWDKQLMLVQSEMQLSAWLDKMYNDVIYTVENELSRKLATACWPHDLNTKMIVSKRDLHYWKWIKLTIKLETVHWPRD